MVCPIFDRATIKRGMGFLEAASSCQLGSLEVAIKLTSGGQCRVRTCTKRFQALRVTADEVLRRARWRRDAPLNIHQVSNGSSRCSFLSRQCIEVSADLGVVLKLAITVAP